MESFAVDKNNSTHNKGHLFNPFPGLRPFTTDESHLFFGREGQSQEILKLLANNRFVALMGTSGSGKSSLMYCGVIPILQGGFVTKAGADWKVITCRPGQNPIQNLSNALAQVISEDSKENELQKEYINTTLSASSLGLSEILNKVPRNKSQNILLLVDQFEELFRFRKIKSSEEAFNEVIAYIKLLLEVLQQDKTPIYIVITMRSDFIGECAQFQKLTQLINDSHYLIPQMTRDDFRKAIEGPIAVGGGSMTPFLTQQLLNDIGDNPDQLPILQHALMRTWNAWTKTGRTDVPIDLKEYENIGRLEKALSEHANEAYNGLTQEQKEICQSLFKTLTEKGGDSRGVRRPTPVYEIADIANTTSDKVIEVVEIFRLPGRSFLSPAPPILLTKDTVIDISHESLMRIWDKLIIWVSEEYEAVQMYKRLANSAEKYQQGKTGLWRPPDLLLALTWRDKQKPTLTWATRNNPAFERTMVYLETSHQEFKLEEENKIKQQKRALRRTRVFAVVLGTASIISIFFMVQAFLNKQKAETQTEYAQVKTEEAEQQKELALKEQKEAEKQKSIALEKEQEAVKQKELADIEKKNAEKSAQVAQYQRKLADRKSKEALEQRKIADESANEAKKQQQIAEKAKLSAQKLRMLSISQSMAVKSLQINIDTTLRGLVAYQAYQFNKKFDGNIFNSDVYDGLYYAHKYFYGNEASDFPAHKSKVRAIALQENSSKFFSTGSDGKIIKLNINNNLDTTLYFNTNNINRTLNISSDEKHLVSGLNSGELLLFNLSDSSAKTEIIYAFNQKVNGSIFQNKNTIIAFDNGGELISYDIELKKLKKIDNSLNLKELFKLNNIYYGTSKNGLFHKIDSFNPLTYKTYILTYSNDGKSGILKAIQEPVSQNETPINSVSISSDEKYIAIGDLLGNVLVFDNNTLDFKHRLTGHTARINSIKFNKNSTFLASASNDGSISIWSTNDFNLAPYKLTDNEAWVMFIKFTNNNDLLAAYADGKIRKWPIDYTKTAEKVKEKINRNFTNEEWQQFVAKDIKYEVLNENF